jgi:hypothetical protein
MPYNAEELVAMRRVIEGVRSFYIASRDAQRARLAAEETARRTALEEARAARERTILKAKSLIPVAAYEMSLGEIGLSSRVLGHLERGGLATVADVMEQMAEGDVGLLELDGIGAKSLAEIREVLDRLELEPEVEEGVAPEAVVEADVAEEPVAAVEVEAEVEVTPEVEVVEAEPVAEEVIPAEAAEPTPAEEPVVEEEVKEVPEDWERFEPAGEQEEQEEEEEEADDLFPDDDRAKKKKRPARKLVYDEELGRVVAVRRRRRGEEDDAVDEEWEDYF